MKLFVTRRSERLREEEFNEELSGGALYAARQMLWKTGWHSYLSSRPPDGVLCEFMRPEWDEPMLSLRRDLNPAMNVYGLYWRLFEEPDSPK